MTQRAAVFVLDSPLPGYLRPVNWTRPSGSLEFKETSTLAMHVASGRASGTDWANGRGGAEIRAMSAGEVIQREIQNTPGQTGHGARITRIEDPKTRRNQGYAHHADFAPGTEEGRWVKRGQLIGHVGNSGKFANGAQMGYHLHCHDQTVIGGVKTHREVWGLLAQNHSCQVNAGASPNLRSSPAGPVIATVRLDGIYTAAGKRIAEHDALLTPRPLAAVTKALGGVTYKWEPRSVAGLSIWVARPFIHFV